MTALPASSSHRLETLDIIRGVAVLGILVMNIQSFSMPESAYSNPLAYGEFGGINYGVWLLSNVFFAGKFMGLFSLLFGVGVAIFLQRLEQRGESAALHFRRLFWLMVFGAIHAYLIWDGDILFAYAVCGVGLYFFRHKPVNQLWGFGIVLLSIWTALYLLVHFGLSQLPDTDTAELASSWQPSQEDIRQEIAIKTGPWPEAFALRIEQAYFMQTQGFALMGVWITGSQMLFGMAMHKQGLFTLKPSVTVLVRAAWLLVIGFSLTLVGIWYNEINQWHWQTSSIGAMLFTYTSAIFISLGYVYAAVYILAITSVSRIRNRLAAIGRMALSNYLAQSVICSFIFYGVGFSQFGRVERWQQIIIVLIIWWATWIWSASWLSRFNYGPMEWLWRCLTYWKIMKNSRFNHNN